MSDEGLRRGGACTTQARVGEPSTSAWATVREALRGSPSDLTAIPVRRAVLLLAIPTVLEMSMESLLTIVDIFYVSKLGPDAVATVGLTEMMLSPVYALAMGLSAAATAMISRRIGEKDDERASGAAGQVVLLALLVAGVAGAVGAPLARTLLGVMGASEGVVSGGSGYTAVMLGGSATIFLLFVLNAVLRSAGDAALAMRSLWIANILNMMVTPVLVFGVGPVPKMGVIGAAIAMTGSRAVGVVYQLSLLVRGRARVAIARRHMRPDGRVLAELAKVATPAALQVSIETVSWLGLVRILATFGSLALAGYTVAMRIITFALLPSWGLAQAAATLVGQNLGARSPDRARRSVLTVAAYNVAFLGPIGLAFVAAPAAFAGLFVADATATAFAADCLRIVSIGFVAFAFGMVAVQAFNGAGDTTTPMLINLACFWLFQIPLAWLLSKKLGWGPRGVFVAIMAAYAVQSVVAGALFRGGRWRRRVAGAFADAP